MARLASAGLAGFQFPFSPKSAPCFIKNFCSDPDVLVVSLEFADATVAGRFERYLKSGSGRAFARRHFGAGG